MDHVTFTHTGEVESGGNPPHTKRSSSVFYPDVIPPGGGYSRLAGRDSDTDSYSTSISEAFRLPGAIPLHNNGLVPKKSDSILGSDSDYRHAGFKPNAIPQKHANNK